MASYDLIVHCVHQTYTVSVHPQMSVSEIIHQISSHLNLPVGSFFLEIYDERIQAYVDFHDQYQDELRQQLPKIYKEKLIARIKLFGQNCIEKDSDLLNDLILPSDTSAKSPIGISTADDQLQADVDTKVDSELIVFSNSIESGSINSLESGSVNSLDNNHDSIDHIIFVRDVIPYEQDEYSSSITNGNKAKGIRKDRHVKRLQGLKTPKEKRFAYILPEIKIPSDFLHKSGFSLVVAVVLEELNGDEVNWHLHKLKGFLPDGTGTDALPLNPFYLDIEQLVSATDGNFRLPLRICSLFETLSVKADDRIFHKVDVNTVHRLHPTEHTPNAPRLACVIADRNKTIQWKTFGLSDFIRPIVIGKSKFAIQKLENHRTTDMNESLAETCIDPSATEQLLLNALTLQSSFANIQRQILDNFVVIWLDFTIDVASNDFLNSLVQLQRSVNDFRIFTDADECLDFLTDVYDMKVFMIISGSLGRNIIPLIHEASQLHSIYIFCENKSNYEQYENGWSKIRGVFNEINYLCTSLKQATREYDRNVIPISLLSTHDTSYKNLNQLDPSFMYTQLIKEALLEIDYGQGCVEELCLYLRELYANNHVTLNEIAKLERQYHLHSPIWWYTSYYFLYSLLNRALRTLDVCTILKMGFYIRDLHCEIENIYSRQSNDAESHPFTVYRGQSLSKTDFEKIKNNKGGLFAFNSFLSTSVDRRISLLFAESNQDNINSIGVLFKITVDPTLITPTPFAIINDQSHYNSEEEILFTMHTVFRIGEILKIDSNEQSWQVELTLTSANDPELNALAKRIREETSSEIKGWHRLGILLTKLGHFDKSEQLYKILLQKAPDNAEKIFLNSQLGVVNDANANYTEAICFHENALQIAESTLSSDSRWFATEYANIAQVYLNMGEYSNALLYCKKALESQQKFLPADHSDFATSYAKMGVVYLNTGDYSNTLSSYEKALAIQQRSLPLNHPNLAESYNRIGQLYEQTGKYAEALLSLNKALEIYQKTLPPNHPDIAISYNSIASVHLKMGEYSKALLLYDTAHDIRQKTLPRNHPYIAQSLNNIGLVYINMAKYSEAISYYEKALEIQQQSLSSDHPHLALLYNNIGSAYRNKGEYSKGLSYHEKATKIQQQSLPSNHPNLASSHNNIGMIYQHTGEYSKAISHYNKALEIREKTLPANHPNLAASYNNVGMVYCRMGEYSRALSYYEKALTIRQQSLPHNHPDLASSYNNIGVVYDNTGDYPKALSSYEKALAMQQQSLPPSHPDLASSYNNIGMVYDNMGDYTKALSSYEKALVIQQQSLPPNHPNLASSYNNIGMIYYNMGDYPKALSSYEKAFAIQQQSLPPSHPDLASSYNNIGMVYDNMDDYTKALSSYEKALVIRQQSLPPTHPNLASSYNNIGMLYDNMGDYSKALSSFEKALAIQQRSLPPGHPVLASSYNNIGVVYNNMGNYSKALLSYEKALEIQQNSLPPNHPALQNCKRNLDSLKKKI